MKKNDRFRFMYSNYRKTVSGILLILFVFITAVITAGCSGFMTYNTEGEPISCKNYDVSHRVSKEDRTFTGLNVVLHCKPEGKYESISLADAVWCDPDDPNLTAGGPDKEDFDIGKLEVLPYECIDGINEKGLFVSIHRLDIKEGDDPGKIAAGSTILLRYLLDDCANVEEAVAKIGNTIASQLHRYLDPDYETYRTKMPESMALVILESVTQNQYTQKTGVSWTQYSAIYNNEKKALRVWSFQDYHNCYAFDLSENRLEE